MSFYAVGKRAEREREREREKSTREQKKRKQKLLSAFGSLGGFGDGGWRYWPNMGDRQEREGCVCLPSLVREKKTRIDDDDDDICMLFASGRGCKEGRREMWVHVRLLLPSLNPCLMPPPSVFITLPLPPHLLSYPEVLLAVLDGRLPIAAAAVAAAAAAAAAGAAVVAQAESAVGVLDGRAAGSV